MTRRACTIYRVEDGAPRALSKTKSMQAAYERVESYTHRAIETGSSRDDGSWFPFFTEFARYFVDVPAIRAQVYGFRRRVPATNAIHIYARLLLDNQGIPLTGINIIDMTEMLDKRWIGIYRLPSLHVGMGVADTLDALVDGLLIRPRVPRVGWSNYQLHRIEKIGLVDSVLIRPTGSMPRSSRSSRSNPASTWQGPPPVCDFCTAPTPRKLESEGVFYDAATRMGPWAVMCVRHYRAYGRPFGQAYEYDKATNAWVKVGNLHKG